MNLRNTDKFEWGTARNTFISKPILDRTRLYSICSLRWSLCKRAGLKLPRIMWAGNISYRRKACCNNISTRWHPLSAKQFILDMIKNFDETFPKFIKASVTQTRPGESLFSQTHLQFLSTILQCRWPRGRSVILHWNYSGYVWSPHVRGVHEWYQT